MLHSIWLYHAPFLMLISSGSQLDIISSVRIQSPSLSWTSCLQVIARFNLVKAWWSILGGFNAIHVKFKASICTCKKNISSGFQILDSRCHELKSDPLTTQLALQDQTRFLNLCYAIVIPILFLYFILLTSQKNQKIDKKINSPTSQLEKEIIYRQTSMYQQERR